MICTTDRIRFGLQAMSRARFRTGMLILALAIGVGAVNLLTGIGEGARLFVLGEFRFLGPNTLIVLPGKKDTRGGMPPLTGEAPHDLTLDDLDALSRLPGVRRTAPLVAGLARIHAGGRAREAMIVGTTGEFFALRQLPLQQGRPLPARHAPQPAVCVIGSTLRQALFGTGPALGQWLRMDDRRCRIIGILRDKGVSMGMNFNEVVLLPVTEARALFNQPGLFRIFVEAADLNRLPEVRKRVRARLTERHDGVEDITLVTQDALLSSLGDILSTLTLGIGIIAAISLSVAGVLIMNMTLITLAQRRTELALLKALGATREDLIRLLLSETLMLALAGAFTGLLASEALLGLLRLTFTDLPFHSPLWAKAASVMLALVATLGFTWLPIRRAARVPPAETLHQAAGGLS